MDPIFLIPGLVGLADRTGAVSVNPYPSKITAPVF
jgi:hypothetical protein